MTAVQLAESADHEQIRQLWKICFGDSDSFMDWFFTHRFVPGYTACVKDGAKLVGAMQSYPLHVRIRGVSLPCAIVAGVSIHPDWRGRGLMREMFTFYMNEMYKKGIMVAPHTPANLSTFFPLGHYPVADSAYAVSQKGEGILFPSVSEIRLDREVDSLLPCYSAFSQRYSGMIDRSMADFQLKMDDYRSDEARCLAWRKRGEVQGYLVYYAPDDVFAVECAALTLDSINQLLSHLAGLYPGKKISAKLPPNLPLSLPAFSVTVCPKGVMGAVRVDSLLQAVVPEGESFSLQIDDPVVPANCGIFTLSGRPTERPPQIRLSCGRLVQLICGYCSLAELEQDHFAEVYDPDAARSIDRLLPKLPCFIIDEY